MTPRSYRMTKRAESVEETRRRIVEATVGLHTTKGFQATSWQDIAERADVAVGTVYYHFPTFDELIPACGALGVEMAAPPTGEIFRDLGGKQRRLERLVEELFAFYGRARGGIENMLREKDQIPALQRLAAEQDAETRSLIAQALGPKAPKRELDVVDALLDFGVWLSLEQRGIKNKQAVRLMTHLIGCATKTGS